MGILRRDMHRTRQVHRSFTLSNYQICCRSTSTHRCRRNLTPSQELLDSAIPSRLEDFERKHETGLAIKRAIKLANSRRNNSSSPVDAITTSRLKTADDARILGVSELNDFEDSCEDRDLDG